MAPCLSDTVLSCVCIPFLCQSNVVDSCLPLGLQGPKRGSQQRGLLRAARPSPGKRQRPQQTSRRARRLHPALARAGTPPQPVPRSQSLMRLPSFPLRRRLTWQRYRPSCRLQKALCSSAQRFQLLHPPPPQQLVHRPSRQQLHSSSLLKQQSPEARRALQQMWQVQQRSLLRQLRQLQQLCPSQPMSWCHRWPPACPMLPLIRHTASLEMLLVGARLRKGRLLRLQLPRGSRWQKQLPSQQQLLSAQRKHQQLLRSRAPRYAHMPTA